MVSRFTVLRFALLLLVLADGCHGQCAWSGRPARLPPSGKKPLTIADYSKWRNIEGAELSSDGKWVAYTLRYTNTLPADSKPSLHLRNLDDEPGHRGA